MADNKTAEKEEEEKEEQEEDLIIYRPRYDALSSRCFVRHHTNHNRNLHKSDLDGVDGFGQFIADISFEKLLDRFQHFAEYLTDPTMNVTGYCCCCCCCCYCCTEIAVTCAKIVVVYDVVVIGFVVHLET